MKRIYQKGFTLIELLVVIAVLGVLAAGVLTAINPLKRINQAKDSQVKSDVGQLVQALQASYTQNQLYPASTGALQASGDLKSIPVPPTGGFGGLSAYGYVRSTTCDASSCSAAVWGPMFDSSTYYCWDSTNNKFKPTSTTEPTADSPTCP